MDHVPELRTENSTGLYSSVIYPNATQKDSQSKMQDWEMSKIIGKRPDVLPTQLTRLGREKVDYLIGLSSGPLNKEKVLELFGGTGLSTALIAAKRPQVLKTVDLHYGPQTGVDWWYDAEKNFYSLVGGLRMSKFTQPEFIAGDAKSLPFKKDEFTLVFAPDAPRTASSRLSSNEGQSMTSGKESEWTPAQQEELFLMASREADRVLKYGGKYIGTAPVNWARKLTSQKWAKIQFFGSKDIGDDVIDIQSPKLRFKYDNMSDPVVYFRCLK